jgi:glutamine synthetase
MTAKEVLDFAKKNKVEMVDVKFVDLLGTWQHFSIRIRPAWTRSRKFPLSA